MRWLRQFFCGHHDTTSEHRQAWDGTWTLTYWHCHGCGKTIGHRS
jgi:hypothetical protein